jgi:hypothetical protein
MPTSLEVRTKTRQFDRSELTAAAISHQHHVIHAFFYQSNESIVAEPLYTASALAHQKTNSATRVQDELPVTACRC